MKSYNEMSNSALQKIEAYEKVRQGRKKAVMKTVTPVLSFCLIAMLGIGAWKFGAAGELPSRPTADISGTDATTAGSTDKIVINRITDIETRSEKRQFIALLCDDFVKMSANELNDYYGVDIFPTVPSDLVSWDEKETSAEYGYGIFRRNRGRGEVYFDTTVLNYSNEDYTRSVNLEVTKDGMPPIDYGVGSENLKKSTIFDCEVYLGCNEVGIYQAKFLCGGAGFVVTTDGLSQAEVLAVIRSVIKQS